MNRIKRTISLLLAFCLVMAFLPVAVMAAEPELVYIRVSDGDTEKSYQVIHENNDIYFSAEAFSEITGYAFTASANYGYQLGRKIIVVNPTNGDLQIPVLHYTGNIGEIIEVDGTHYLSASQLLPWMNVTCSVNNGVLTIVADKASIWKITQDLDYSLYMFNLYEQYGDSFGSVSGLIAMTVFDTILHTGLDRIVPSGKGGSQYTYECYVQALSELGSDRPDLDDETIKTLKKYVDVSDGIDPLAEFIGGKMEDGRDGLREHLKDVGLDDESILNILSISDDWDQMRECLSVPGAVTEYVDIFEAYKTYELILETDDEYRDYLAWLADRGTGTRMFDDALDEAQTCLDENKGVIYTLISGFAEKLLEIVPPKVFKAIASNSMNDTVIKAFNVSSAVTEVWSSYSSYLSVSKLLFELVVPEAVKGYEGMAKVGVLENIQDHCWNLAGYLQNEELTEENIVHIRQSYMTALRASRQMFESQNELSKFIKFGAEDYAGAMAPQLKLINMKIQQLIASANCTENDSVEGKQEYADLLKEMFAAVSFQDQYVSEADYISFLNEHPEYNYYAILDVNGDGIFEMLASETLFNHRGDFTSCGEYVDLFVYKDGKIRSAFESIRSKYTRLAYDAENQWIVSSIGGSGGSGLSFVYLDEALEAKELSFESYCHGVDQDGNEIWTKYYNGKEVTAETQDAYTKLYETWENSNCEDIIFQALPKAMLIGEWKLYCGGIPYSGYWVDVVLSSLNLKSDGSAEVMLAYADSEAYRWYTGSWMAEPSGNNEFLLKLDVAGGPISYEEESSAEENSYSLSLKATLDKESLTFEKIRGEDICLYYGERYERNLQFDVWLANKERVKDPITFEKLLQVYPETAYYTVYDIDKDGDTELIIRETSNNYLIFAYEDENVDLCSQWILTTCNFYPMDGNGVIVQTPNYVSVYELTEGYLQITTYSSDVEAFLSDTERKSEMLNFIPVSDKTLLKK